LPSLPEEDGAEADAEPLPTVPESTRRTLQ
jgi:hypothetical protein